MLVLIKASFGVSSDEEVSFPFAKTYLKSPISANNLVKICYHLKYYLTLLFFSWHLQLHNN